MSFVDWIILAGTLLGIVAYGTWKTRNTHTSKAYLQGDKNLSWAAIGLSVMATQASAITFLSTPGLAYESGMAFIQNYFGLPLALIVVSAFFIPLYYKLNVFTAYEFLEKRFDVKTRLLAAFLFLIQRGLAAGITIYAPAIILSSTLGWDLSFTIIVVGVLVIIYTVSGGSKAVSLTHKWQMAVIMIGMFAAFFILLYKLPDNVGFMKSLDIAGKLGKMELVSFSFDPNVRYTFWSGIAGGFFLALSYFGTDQSQVQRYIGGKNTNQSRLGLMFNAILKIPMQFFILLTGVMVFVFYQFTYHPVLFDETSVNKVKETSYAQAFQEIEGKHKSNYELKLEAINAYVINGESPAQIQSFYNESRLIRDEAKVLVKTALPSNTAKDSDYVFLSFIMHHLPMGLVGLLLAVIISAAMSSTSGELNALAATTCVDFYKRLYNKDIEDGKFVIVSKWISLLWGMLAITFALLANLVENLIEAVNILGSLFYGTILGIFLLAFFIKKVGAKAVFIAAISSELLIIYTFVFHSDSIAYLWLNVLGCFLTIALALMVEVYFRLGTTK